MYRYNRYRYHKNLIINKGLLSLVGISDCSLLELGSFNHRRRLEYFIAFSPVLNSTATPDQTNRFCLIAYLGRVFRFAATSSLWLSCPRMIGFEALRSSYEAIIMS
jgi:hypothetical protein